jgi:siderophore synthetase component
MLAQRVFVMFAPAFFLKHLKFLGFRTFDSVIDESYDEEFIDVKRFQMAFREMLSLTQRDPVEIYKQVQDILEHNRQHMFELQSKTSSQMQSLLQATIPKPFFI